jgi:hypothetical protein
VTEKTGLVLHLDFIGLAPGVGPEARAALIAEAGRLAALDEVEGVGVIEADEGSDFDVVLWFLLPSFEALEPFGTDARYTHFLQGTVARVVKGFAGADVRLEGQTAPVDGPAACLALAAPDETYDWEVRQTLSAWAEGTASGSSSIGLAVGERQRYRGVAIAFGEGARTAPRVDEGRFGSTLVLGTARTLG